MLLREEIMRRKAAHRFHHVLRDPAWPDTAGVALRGESNHTADQRARAQKEEHLKWLQSALKMQKLEGQLKQMEAQLAEIEREVAENAQSTATVKRVVSRAGSEHDGRGRTQHIERKKRVDIKTVLPPGVLGEQTVLHPGVGSLVTVTAL